MALYPPGNSRHSPFHLSLQLATTMSDTEEYAETFESAESGASHTFPMQAGLIRKGAHIVIKGRPCKVRAHSAFPLCGWHDATGGWWCLVDALPSGFRFAPPVPRRAAAAARRGHVGGGTVRRGADAFEQIGVCVSGFTKHRSMRRRTKRLRLAHPSIRDWGGACRGVWLRAGRADASAPALHPSQRHGLKEEADVPGCRVCRDAVTGALRQHPDV
jgi:hypothetical protein